METEPLALGVEEVSGNLSHFYVSSVASSHVPPLPLVSWVLLPEWPRVLTSTWLVIGEARWEVLQGWSGTLLGRHLWRTLSILVLIKWWVGSSCSSVGCSIWREQDVNQRQGEASGVRGAGLDPAPSSTGSQLPVLCCSEGSRENFLLPGDTTNECSVLATALIRTVGEGFPHGLSVGKWNGCRVRRG